jgi:hypothetical protein
MPRDGTSADQSGYRADGWLWAVPFTAILGPGTLLLDRADTVLAPSLRFLCALTDRETGATAVSAVSWHDPASGFDAPELAGLGGHPGGHVRLADARQVREAFVRGGATWRTAVLPHTAIENPDSRTLSWPGELDPCSPRRTSSMARPVPRGMCHWRRATAGFLTAPTSTNHWGSL